MHSMWGNEILALPHCAADLAEDGQLINFGPRVRIGMCEGNPTMVMPHSTSGRCDYWGPFVNRQAALRLFVRSRTARRISCSTLPCTPPEAALAIMLSWIT